MKNVFLAVVLGFVGSVLSYNANINVNHYGSCEKEIRSYQLDHRHQYIKPHTFLYIPDLANNDAKVDEILRTKIYFRGFGDFSVGVSQYPNSENTPFFHTGEHINWNYLIYCSNVRYSDGLWLPAKFKISYIQKMDQRKYRKYTF